MFRHLMIVALSICDARAPAATLLYTETPQLYEPFGFRPLAQHAVVGQMHTPLSRGKTRQLDVREAHDAGLMSHLIARRTVVSKRCAILADSAMFFAAVAADPSLRLVYFDALDALVVFEHDDDDLVIVDVVAPEIPMLAALVGGLEPKAKRVRCLFPPDRLDWHGDPVREDTGLMIRGPIPPSMQRPFMFPPTVEF